MRVIGLYPENKGQRGNNLFPASLMGVMLWIILFGQTVDAYEEKDVIRGGAIAGIVKISGPIPSPETYKVTMGSNPEFCRTIADEKGLIVLPRVHVSSHREVADVVVFLQEVERGKRISEENPLVMVDQCRFNPRVIGTMAGTTLRMKMRDPIIHQLRGWEILDNGRLPLFHLPNLEKGGEANVPLKARRSSIIKLECDQHRFMQSWLLLTANPYVTVTDDHGMFQLTDVPEGTHTVGAWHPVLGYQEAKVTLGPGHQEILDLVFSSAP